MNDILDNNLDLYLNNIDLILNIDGTAKYMTERERRIYFVYNLNTYEIYCIAFDERMIQLLAHSISTNISDVVMYDYKQY